MKKVREEYKEWSEYSVNLQEKDNGDRKRDRVGGKDRERER